MAYVQFMVPDTHGKSAAEIQNELKENEAIGEQTSLIKSCWSTIILIIRYFELTLHNLYHLLTSNLVINFLSVVVSIFVKLFCFTFVFTVKF